LLALYARCIVEVTQKLYDRRAGRGDEVENLLVCALDAQTQRNDRPARVGQWFG
jgi:hypothetical protein